MLDEQKIELRGLKLSLIDLISEYCSVDTVQANLSPAYVSAMCVYEPELEALVGLSVQEQQKGLRAIAHKVIASYQIDKNGGH